MLAAVRSTRLSSRYIVIVTTTAPAGCGGAWQEAKLSFTMVAELLRLPNKQKGCCPKAMNPDPKRATDVFPLTVPVMG